MEFVLAEAVNGAFIKRKDGHEVSADVGMCAGWNKSRLKEEMLFLTWSEVGFEPVYRIWSPAPLIKFWWVAVVVLESGHPAQAAVDSLRLTTSQQTLKVWLGIGT